MLIGKLGNQRKCDLMTEHVKIQVLALRSCVNNQQWMGRTRVAFEKGYSLS